jgi:hypothetical protein
MEFEKFYKLQKSDLKDKRWTAHDPTCPVFQMIDHFNHVSFWVVGTILSFYNPATRAQAIARFAELATVSFLIGAL